MLDREIEKNPLFVQMDALVSPMGFRVVDVYRNDRPGGIQLHLTVFSGDHEVNTDDLAAVYNVVYPRFCVLWNTRDLELEVSSPGMQRVFRDWYEFSVFCGRLVRLYSNRWSSNIEAVIVSCDDDSVTLGDVLIVDRNEKMDELVLVRDEVQKARLTYRWEEKK